MNWSQTFGESNTNEFYSTEWGNNLFNKQQMVGIL